MALSGRKCDSVTFFDWSALFERCIRRLGYPLFPLVNSVPSFLVANSAFLSGRPSRLASYVGTLTGMSIAVSTQINATVS